MKNVVAKAAKKFRRRYEPVDSVPLAKPIGYKKEPSINERLRQMVRSEALAQEAAKAGAGTFDEEDDFSEEDGDDDPQTPYEEIFEGDVLKDNFEVLKARAPKPPIAELSGKTYTGKDALKKVVDFFRTASQEDIDKVLEQTDKDKTGKDQ